MLQRSRRGSRQAELRYLGGRTDSYEHIAKMLESEAFHRPNGFLSEFMVRLAPFLIIVVLLEEVIPLIAIYAPFMLPSTCILPSQRERIENAKRSKQAAYVANNRQLFRHLATAESGHLPLGLLRGNPSLAEVVCGCIFLRSWSLSCVLIMHWHRALRLPTWGPNAMRIWRIRRYLLHISEDDELLIKEDMSAKLSPIEITEALLERGM